MTKKKALSKLKKLHQDPKMKEIYKKTSKLFREDPDLKKFFRKEGFKGKKFAGDYAKTLTPEQRSEKARKAAQAYWAKRKKIT